SCRKKMFKCDLGGRYTQKLLRLTSDKMKLKESKKQGCMWQINVMRPVNSQIVTVMQICNEYNHEISIDTLQFTSTYKVFHQEIMKQIEYYVVHGRCDALTIRNLLQPKYPDRIFLTQDLGNAIQRIKRERGISLGDVTSLLLKLLDLQSNNSAWFVRPLLDET